MAHEFTVTVTAGSLRDASDPSSAHFPHRWTDGGVEVSTAFTGAHLLHTAVAGCVLNDLYREAQARGIELRGVRVRASGGFSEDWSSTGITYTVELDSGADPTALDALMTVVDEVAEIPRALRASTTVSRAPSTEPPVR